MKRNLCTFAFLVTIVSVFSQSYWIDSALFRGAVFLKEYDFIYYHLNEEPFSPSYDEISYAESVLRDSINSYLVTNNIHTKIINKDNLQIYTRQYKGILLENGEKVIYVSLFKGNIPQRMILANWLEIQDGGEYVWSIAVNITRRTLFGIFINGVA